MCAFSSVRAHRLPLAPRVDSSLLSQMDHSFFQKLRSKATRLFVTSLFAPPEGLQFPEFWSKVTPLSVTSLPVSQFKTACVIDVFFFFALSWTLLLEGPHQTKSQKKKKKVFIFTELGPCRFFGEKVMVMK